jgi:hypothetical protein
LIQIPSAWCFVKCRIPFLRSYSTKPDSSPCRPLKIRRDLLTPMSWFVASECADSYCIRAMIHFFSQYALRPSGLPLIVVFAASLLWCGDADCWSGASDGQCASLICSLLANHGSQNENQAGHGSTECMCVCHMPTIPGNVFDAEQVLTAQTTSFEFSTFTPPSPTHSIYHPPKS